MNIYMLSIATNDNFVRDILKGNGPISMRLAYPIRNLEHCATVAKKLVFFSGLNKKKAFTIWDVSNLETKVVPHIQDHLDGMIAIAIAYQNEGQFVRNTWNTVSKNNILTSNHLHQKKDTQFNRYVFDYVWKSLSRYGKDRDMHENDAGPVYDHVREFVAQRITEDKRDLNQVAQKQCYLELNKKAGYSDMADVEAAVWCKKDWLFDRAWEKACKSL